MSRTSCRNGGSSLPSRWTFSPGGRAAGCRRLADTADHHILCRRERGIVPGNGDYALGRQGRYAHAVHYVYKAVYDAGLLVLGFERRVIRKEGGANVPGLLLTLGHANPSARQ